MHFQKLIRPHPGPLWAGGVRVGVEGETFDALSMERSEWISAPPVLLPNVPHCCQDFPDHSIPNIGSLPETCISIFFAKIIITISYCQEVLMLHLDYTIPPQPPSRPMVD